MQGEAYVKIWIIEVEGQVLVNNEYIAGCAAVNGFGVQGHYHFKDGGVGGGFFVLSNCSDQLKEFKEKPATKHSGGFVKEESARFPATSGLSGLTGRSPRHLAAAAAGGESETFDLPEGTQGQELRVTSASGSPVVRVTVTRRRELHDPLRAWSRSRAFPASSSPHSLRNTNQLLILLKHPKGGTWTIQALPGSGPLSKLEAAEDVPPASVRIHVRHARGRNYALTYKIAHYVRGSAVSFVERGRDSTHVLGTVKRAHGTLRFAPEEALSRSRRVFAYLLNGEGVEVRELPVGRYSAPGPFRPGKPRVKIARRRSTALVTWSAVSGARRYRVTVRGSDGRLETHILAGSARSVPIPGALGFEGFTATVTAVGGKDMLSGRPATATAEAGQGASRCAQAQEALARPRPAPRASVGGAPSWGPALGPPRPVLRRARARLPGRPARRGRSRRAA